MIATEFVHYRRRFPWIRQGLAVHRIDLWEGSQHNPTNRQGCVHDIWFCRGSTARMRRCYVGDRNDVHCLFLGMDVGGLANSLEYRLLLCRFNGRRHRDMLHRQVQSA